MVAFKEAVHLIGAGLGRQANDDFWVTRRGPIVCRADPWPLMVRRQLVARARKERAPVRQSGSDSLQGGESGRPQSEWPLGVASSPIIRRRRRAASIKSR